MRFLLGFVASTIAAVAATTGFADVAPLIEKHCTGCHQPGEIGPMAFTSYSEVRPWAKAIRAAVLSRTMPPWHADAKGSTHFSNSRALSDAEVSLLTRWVDEGAPQGSRPAAIRIAKKSNGWTLGAKPDLIVSVPPHAIPAGGIMSYVFVVRGTNFPEDKWIRGAEWRIDQRQVVHHMNAFIRPPGSSYLKTAPRDVAYVATSTERAARRADERETDRRELLAGYEPGYRPAFWQEGRAKLLRKGSDIVFEIHYTPNGKETTDASELGLYFASEPPRERVLTITPADANMAIPPGDPNYVTRMSATMKSPVDLISLQPHMHLRGKAFQVQAVFPDGRTQRLLDVPKYDFNWQTTYYLKLPLRLPEGARLDYVGVFDNSPNNKSNPDPSQTVRWGDQSYEEMSIGFTEIAFPVSADAEVAVLSGTTRPAGGPKAAAKP